MHRDVPLSALFYLGTLLTVIGALLLLSRRKRVATGAATAGIAVAVAALSVPAATTRISIPTTLLDRFMPEYEHVERHETLINASPALVHRAIEEVPPGEIRFFLLLTGIRGLNPTRPQDDRDRPLLDIARSTSFIDLGSSEREIVLGTIGQFWRIRGGGSRQPVIPESFPGYRREGSAKAAINFLTVPHPDGATRLVTETRIATGDTRARRHFTAYWRVIYPGSALIRRMWLSAIRKRAEAEG